MTGSLLWGKAGVAQAGTKEFLVKLSPSILIPASVMTMVVASACVAGSARLPFSADYARPHQRVAIDGSRRLNLFCVGSGSPTIVFEAGFGDGAMVWRAVQRRIGAHTRACSYDRAGYGFSDAASRVSDLRNNEDDLARLLRSGALGRPVLLVAHSFGGLIAVQYALHHPSEIAGMVLVDPAFAGQWKVASRLSPAAQAVLRTKAKETVQALQECARLARQGALAQPRNRGSACLDNPPSTQDPIVHAELNRELRTAAREEADLSSYVSDNPSTRIDTTTSDSEASATTGNLGNMPLIVLTATSATPAGFNAADRRMWRDNWMNGHEKVARLSSRGRTIMVPGSSHFIQLDRPAAVVDAVVKLIEQVRATSQRRSLK